MRTTTCSVKDSTDGRLSNPKLASQGGLLSVCSGGSRSYFRNLRFGQVCPRAFVASRVPVSALGNLVEHIVQRGAEEPIGGVLARGIVAVMQHRQSSRDGANEVLVPPSVSTNITRSTTGQVRPIPESSVPSVGAAAGPRPTAVGIRLINLAEVPLHGGFGSGSHLISVTNPGMTREAALRLAEETVRRYPKVAAH